LHPDYHVFATERRNRCDEVVTEARLAALAHSPTIVASAEEGFKDLTENVQEPAA
jgi:hypothetical protein